MSKILPKRSEVPAQMKWKIEDLYASDELWEQDYMALSEDLKKLGEYKGKLAQGASVLLDALRMQDEISCRAEKVYVYANQKLHEDTGDGVYQGLAGRAQLLMTKIYAQAAYLAPEILGLPEETLKAYFEEEEGLAVYGHYMEELLRDKKYTLSPELEELLAKTSDLSDAPQDIFSNFNNADIKFPTIWGEEGEPIEVTHGKYISLLENSDREIRRSAFESMYGTYEKYKNTLAAAYRANVKQAGFYASVRGYESSLAAALYGSAIPVSVYDNLIETVHGNLHHLHRYAALRKKILGLDKLHMYDLYVPMVADADRKIPYEEALEMVKKGLEPMGEEYLNILQEGFENGWIDVCENRGKRSGAYSWGAYGTHPFVLLNYQENLNNVFTIAHEMGHSIHSYYSDASQPYCYAGYRIFVAEVASTCNEALLIHSLMEQAKDKKEKAYLINYFLEQFRTTLYRQTMFAEFEKITHAKSEAGEMLTAEELCKIYYDLNVRYFGDDVEVDKEIAMEWARIPHFYTPFYVYQYATGFSAAIALSAGILARGEDAVKDYKRFLKGGSSAYPLELLRFAGVDMESPEPVQQALDVFAKYLDEMEELLKDS